jgi:bilirubin oxidase
MHTRYTLLLLLISGAASAQNPLIIPDTLTGTVFNLDMHMATRNFYPGITTNTIGINADYLGPTLFLNDGDSVTMNVTNSLSDTTTLHWHGMHVPSQADGGPHITISPGTVWSPSFVVKNKAAMHWYHSHLHMGTAEQVTKGAAGIIIVRDQEEAALNLPRTYGIDDIPLAVQTRGFDPSGQFITETALDTAVMVNGTVTPYVNLPAQVVRLRLLNAATERAFNFGFSNNQVFYQVGTDGGLLPAPVSMTRLMLVPGERAEILVDLATAGMGPVYLRSFASQIPAGIYGATNPQAMGSNIIPNYTLNPLNGGDFDILQINITPPLPFGIFSIPATLANYIPIPPASANKTRDFMFQPQVMGPTGSLLGPFVINMMPFDMMMINDTVKLNDTEIWQLTNQSRISHPFHVHDVEFQILDINGVPPSPGMSGWKDVVLVPPMMGTVRFIAKFEDYADPVWPYMYHCHMLTHEDDGMMGSFIVVDSTTGIPDAMEVSIFNLYPNPVSGGIIHLDASGNPFRMLKWTITDISGKLVMTDNKPGARVYTESISLGSLSQGVYFLKVETSSGIFYKKIIIARE